MHTRPEPNNKSSGLKDEKGFTLLETIAGLVVMLTVLAIFALYLLPYLLGLPKLYTQVTSSIQVAQVQNLINSISQELQIPAWWKADFVEVKENDIIVKDIGYKFTTKEEVRPPLLEVKKDENHLFIIWKSITYAFELPVTLEYKKKYIVIQVKTEDPVELLIPLNQLVYHAGE